MSQLGQRVTEFSEAGAQVAGIAVTAVYSQQAFARSLGIDFPLLSDWSREVSRAYGASYELWKGHDGVAKRALFLVAADGTVAYRWVTEDAEILPDLGLALEAVRAL